MAAERVATVATIESAYEAELRVDADVSATIDTPIRIHDSAPGPVVRGLNSQVWLDAQSAGVGRERDVGVATVAVMT